MNSRDSALSSPRFSQPGDAYDAVVVGGGFAGAAFATLLKRWRPEARILVVERRGAHGRKVGEATVEISGFFLHHVLGLRELLLRDHLPKHGLRYWFTDRPDRPLERMSEVGPRVESLVPSFLLDRSLLDEQLLDMARREGCEVARPARVADIDLGWPRSRLRLETEDGDERRVTARWVVDASGRQAILARRLGLHRPTAAHPTAALWARWEGVADLDGPAVLGPDPLRPRLTPLRARRRLATNHFCGYGWWCWMIPLSSGRTSVGLVYNKELMELPGTGPLKERYRRFVTSQAGLAELLAGARMNEDEDDFLAYHHLPYTTERYMDRGWALVGDAASFMDPYYSPGLDHASLSIYATARLIESDLGGAVEEDALAGKIRIHNEHFRRSYERWLSALYLGKYEILGDAELAGSAFMTDTALYYLGVVSPIYEDAENLRNPVFGVPLWQASAAFHFMDFYRRRLTYLARFRRATGTYGRRNVDWRFYPAVPGLRHVSLKLLGQGLGLWLRAEWEHLCHAVRSGGAPDLPRPVAAS